MLTEIQEMVIELWEKYSLGEFNIVMRGSQTFYTLSTLSETLEFDSLEEVFAEILYDFKEWVK